MSSPFHPDRAPFYRPVAHNMLRRARWHDYSEPGLYMLTIVVAGRKPLLGRLSPDPTPHIELSPLGLLILNQELPKIHAVYPIVDVLRVCVMPDHVHMIVSVSETMPDRKHLGSVIGAFKGGCTRAWRALAGERVAEQSLYEKGYNDRVLVDNDQVLSWIHYLEDNPRRLMLKRQNPDLFTTLSDYDVAGMKCQIFGNRFLLDIPDKMSVVVHRADSDSAYADKFGQWMACGERGGVLVGTGIAPREKVVMREAMDRGYCLIVLREQGFPKIYKPSGESFDACAEGRLLQVSPWSYHFDARTITRRQCLDLNSLGRAISQGR